MIRRPRQALAVGTLVISVLIEGCTLLRPGIEPLARATATEVLESLAARRAAMTSFRARARLREGGTASIWVREVILVQRPRTLRVDVLSPFGLAMALGTNGTTLWAYPPSEGVRYEGPATPDNLRRIVGASIAIEDLIDVLMGLPPSRVPVEPPSLETTPDRQYRLVVPLASGAQHLWLKGDPLVLVRAEEHTEDGRALSVTFGEHRDGFPRAIEVVAPSTGNTVSLRYDEIESNPVLDGTVFDPPAAPRVRPLPTGTAG